MHQRFRTFTLLNAQISRCLRRIKTEEMADIRLKSGHVSCLHYLYEVGPMTARELCEICEEDKANISRSMEYLEKNGYISPLPDEKRRYKRRYTLTEKGMEAAVLIDEKIEHMLSRAGKGVSEEDRHIMYASLAKISTNLQRICDEYDNK